MAMSIEPSLYKVVHFSTSTVGGAGIAALRLHQSLVMNGVNSKLITLSPNKDLLPNVFQLKRSPARIMYSKLLTFFNLRFTNGSFFSIFSTGIRFKKLMTVAFANADVDPKNTVIHIHNWYNMISISSLRKMVQLGFNVVVTLHDERLLTGGCHYTLGCEQLNTGCTQCPHANKVARKFIAENSQQTLKLTMEKGRLHLIAPSQWLLQRIPNSKQLQLAQRHQIYNVTSPAQEFSKNQPANLKRATFDKPLRNHVGVASMDKNSWIKGADKVSELELELASNPASFDLVHLVDWIKTGKSQEQFWNEISALLVISRADNSPNVIAEAKMHNVPIIGANVGGIPELLDKEFDLVIDWNDLSSGSLREICQEFLEKTNSNKDLSAIIKNYKKMVGDTSLRHMSFYESIIGIDNS